jgi:drug/metabolite transporter (DMT)-like permease
MFPTSHTTRGLALAILAGLIFGTAALFTRLISGISPLAISASRLTLGFFCMTLLIGGQGKVPEVQHSLKTQRVTLLLLGILSSFHFLLFVLAVQKTLIANALMLVNTAPILVLILAPVFLQEPTTATDSLSVVITFLGASLIVGVDTFMLGSEHAVGDVCALGSALCYALYVIVARKLRRNYSAPVIMGWFFGLGAAFLWIGGIVLRDDFFVSPSHRSWLFLMLLGLLPTGIGHFSYNLSLKYVPAAKASTIILLEPVSGTLLAWIFFNEVPPVMSGVGILIVLIGISITSLIDENKKFMRGSI